MLSTGMAIGWPSPNLPKLLYDPDNPFNITLAESSWVGALLDLGSALSALPMVLLMDKYDAQRSEFRPDKQTHLYESSADWVA